MEQIKYGRLLIKMIVKGIVIPAGAYVKILESDNVSIYFRKSATYKIEYNGIETLVKQEVVDYLPERKYLLRKQAVTMSNCIYQRLNNNSSIIVKKDKTLNVVGHLNGKRSINVLLQDEEDILIADSDTVYFPKELIVNRNEIKQMHSFQN